MAIKCRKDFTEMDRAFCDFSAQAIGCSDDLSSSKTAASQKAAADLRPMVSPGIRIDSFPRRSSH